MHDSIAWTVNQKRIGFATIIIDASIEIDAHFHIDGEAANEWITCRMNQQEQWNQQEECRDQQRQASEDKPEQKIFYFSVAFNIFKIVQPKKKKNQKENIYSYFVIIECWRWRSDHHAKSASVEIRRSPERISTRAKRKQLVVAAHFATKIATVINVGVSTL